VNASGVGEGGWECVAAADGAAAGGGEGWAAGGGEDNLELIPGEGIYYQTNLSLSCNDSQAPRAATLEPSLRQRGITSPEKTAIPMDRRSMTPCYPRTKPAVEGYNLAGEDNYPHRPKVHDSYIYLFTLQQLLYIMCTH
jgi:hypothetical protein